MVLATGVLKRTVTQAHESETTLSNITSLFEAQTTIVLRLRIWFSGDVLGFQWLG